MNYQKETKQKRRVQKKLQLFKRKKKWEKNVLHHNITEMYQFFFNFPVYQLYVELVNYVVLKL